MERIIDSKLRIIVFILLGYSSLCYSQKVADFAFPHSSLYHGEFREEMHNDYRNGGLLDIFQWMPMNGSNMVDSVYFESHTSADVDDMYFKTTIDSLRQRYTGMAIYRDPIPMAAGYMPDSFKVRYDSFGRILESYVLNATPSSSMGDTLYHVQSTYDVNGLLVERTISDGVRYVNINSVDSFYDVRRDYFYSGTKLDSTKQYDLNTNRLLDEIWVYQSGANPDSAIMHRYPSVLTTFSLKEYYLEWTSLGLVKDSAVSGYYGATAVTEYQIPTSVGFPAGAQRLFTRPGDGPQIRFIYATNTNYDSIGNVRQVFYQKWAAYNSDAKHYGGLFHLYYSRVSSLGTEELERNHRKHDIFVYPNPTSDNVFIEQREGVQLESVHLVDLQGRLVKAYSSRVSQFSVSSLNDGVYLLYLKLENGAVEVQKIQVNH